MVATALYKAPYAENRSLTVGSKMMTRAQIDIGRPKIQPEQQPKSSSSNKFLQSTKITNFCNKHRERYQLEIEEIAGRHIHFLAQLEVEDFQG